MDWNDRRINQSFYNQIKEILIIDGKTIKNRQRDY